MKKMLYSLLSVIVCFMALGQKVSAVENRIVLSPGNFSILIPDGECEQVRLAAEALSRDFGKVTGFSPSLTSSSADGASAEVVVVNEATEGSEGLLAVKKDLDGFESHRVFADASANRIYLYGKDMRGTIYAIYSFSEQVLGVPPLWYWCDWQPEKKGEVTVEGDFDYFCPSPQVRYRAWFPNDEDLFIPWRKKSTENNEMWLETMLRLKGLCQNRRSLFCNLL